MLAVLKNLKLPFPITLVEGGKTRKESVETAVYALGEVDAVLIHDGARPNVSTALINRVLDAGKSSNAVIPGLKVTDTVKWVENGTVIKTIDRNFLVRVQTPQYFELSALKNAYKQAINDATDEAMLLESLGINIMVVDGEEENVKITYPEDKKFLG